MAMAADGRILDERYRLDRLIASGERGEVWLATDQVLARPVTVKLLRVDRAGEPEKLARFRVEARLASSITHRNLVRVFDYNDAVDGQPPFLVMEFVPGESLADLLAAGPLPVPATLDLLAQVAAGVDAARQAGLVRLDVRPANVLLCGDGSVKVADFGIGGPAEAEGAAEPDSLGSLGALAQECVRGQEPDRVPAAVAALIAELTGQDSANRPGSAAEVAKRAAALRKQLAPRRLPPRWPAAMVSKPAEPDPDPDPDPHGVPLPRRQSRRRLLLVPAAVLVLFASFLLLVESFDRGIFPAQNDIHAGNRTVLLAGAAFRNQPVSVVDGRLRRMGFTVRNRWQRSATVPAGLVIAVSPTGRLPVGSLVTVLGSGPAGSGRALITRTGPSPHRTARHRRGGRTGGPSPRGTKSHTPVVTAPPSSPTTPAPTPSPTGTPTPAPTPSQTPTSSPSSPSQTPSGSSVPSGSPAPSGRPAPSGSSAPSGSGSAAIAAIAIVRRKM